jgi:3-isopropylmalate/(R)-2-methylmalate dehydratase small subunit
MINIEIITGRVWKFGDDINTDLIFPHASFHLSPEEQVKQIFKSIRPGWTDEVQPGHIIVGGRNFGTGSSRPAPRVLKQLNIGALIADSVNGLFYRNCANFGLLALRCDNISEAFEEMDIAEIDFNNFTIKNQRTGQVLHGQPIPQNVVHLMSTGGLFPMLRAEGFLD